MDSPDSPSGGVVLCAWERCEHPTPFLRGHASPLNGPIRHRHLQNSRGISLKDPSDSSSISRHHHHTRLSTLTPSYFFLLPPSPAAGPAVVAAAHLPASRETGKDQWWGGRPRPYFSDTPTNLTVISGQTAFLPCRVHMLGERSVSCSWRRKERNGKRREREDGKE